MPIATALGAGEPGSEKLAPAPGGPAFVKLPLFSIPVIEGDKVTRQVAVGIVLELGAGQTLADLKPKENVLIDAFLRELYGIFAQRSGADRIADQHTLKERLGRTADRVLGSGVVRQVLIQQLFEQNRPK